MATTKKKTPGKDKEKRDRRGRKGKRRKETVKENGVQRKDCRSQHRRHEKKNEEDFQCFWITLPSDSTVHGSLARISVLWGQIMELLYHEF